MIKRIITLALLAVATCAFTGPAAFADSGNIAVGVKAGTLGFGGEVTAGLTPSFNARVSYNGYNYNGSSTQNQIIYDYKLSLGSFPVLLDWYPFEGSAFRLSPGVVFNNNKISATGTSKQVSSYVIGGKTYSTAQIGSLVGNADFNKTAPYAGLGWGNAVGKDSGLSVVFDLGVMFQGSPTIALSATNPAMQNDPTFKASLDKEIADVKDKTDKLKYYPVVSLGLAYRF